MKRYVTILKVIATFLVIIIHTISRTWNILNVSSVSFKTLTLIDCFCRCAVPIFIMCSGAIFINRDDKLKDIIFKYILKLYLVFIIFNSIYKLFKLVLLENNMLSFNLIKEILFSSIKFDYVYQFWFLKIIIICYAFIIVFRFIRKKNSMLLDIFVLLILFFLLADFESFQLLNINYNFRYLLYFYLGYFFDKYNNKYFNIIFSLLGIISIIYMYKNTITISVINNSALESYLYYLNISVIFTSIMLFGLVKTICKYYQNIKIYNFFKFQYKYIFGIYLIHGLVIGLLDKVNIIDIYNINSVFKVITSSLLIYLISMLLIIIYYKLKSKIKIQVFR